MLFTNDVTKEMREFPKKVFVFMGSLDGLSGFLGAVGGAYTPGQLQTLINQTVIPMTLVFSILFLKTKYQRWQYVGAALIMAGAVVATVPQFLGGGSSSTSTKWYAILVFFAGIWPSSMYSLSLSLSLSRFPSFCAPHLTFSCCVLQLLKPLSTLYRFFQCLQGVLSQGRRRY
eukprot:TRINITY_DN438_c0_g1_i18.p1 TRINITY_DN438_c0_g1~~TRINITY_DN438_c0_g1_i18.p1  ORF type:complete len:183 (+),score=26.29 TRINITY_DN438_c0_g1_i18:31-549(+)